MSNLYMFFFICIILIYKVQNAFDIMNFGAVPHSDNVKDQIQNSDALMKAIKAASQSVVDRVVRVPAKTFYTMPFKLQNIDNIKLQILGRIAASKSAKFWPQDSNKHHQNFIQITNCSNIQISGGGKIDGRGYHWWMLLLLNNAKYIGKHDNRPHLIFMLNCQYIVIHDLILKNSPQFHLKMDHCHHAHIYNLAILVNTTAQLNLLKSFSLQGSLIMFPFNTDGIDPMGSDMHIHNLTVQNFDDVVVPKPGTDQDCTGDMMVEDIQVRLGVGMSIGSVPPHQPGSCVRNVTFRNVNMLRPFKGIYVKTNPGNKYHGNITNIYYHNFTMDRPIWWAIYIGPQQMRQPNGLGPGCMLYPFDKRGTCTTQPLVTIKNITLQDITIHKSLLYPVTIRCNVSNPCTQINFINVKTDEWVIGQKQKGYVCEFATGKGIKNSPPIHCLQDQPSQFAQKNQSHDEQTTRLHSPSQLYKSTISHLQQTISNPTKLFSKLLNLTKSYLYQQQYLIRQVFEEIQKAILEVGYVEEDDQFNYDLKQVLEEFQQQIKQ